MKEKPSGVLLTEGSIVIIITH